jgi:PAP2 superfamily
VTLEEKDLEASAAPKAMEGLAMTRNATEAVPKPKGTTTHGRRAGHPLAERCVSSWDGSLTLTGNRRSSAGTFQRATANVNAALRPLLSWRPGMKDGAEILLLALALPLYYLVRGQVEERTGEAVQRGADIVTLERQLGIFWEVELQKAAIDYGWLVDSLNAFYLYGHLPLIGALAVWLYFWHRPQYLLMRNAFLISGGIALVIYLNFPTAPPRLLPEHLGFGFVDTVFHDYGEERPFTPSFFVNQYAAMPSMHFGWNMLVGLALWLATRNVLIRGLAILMPFAMLTSIILTANHYILDPVMAIPVVAAGLAIALGGRWLVLRTLSPESKAARESGWASWVYWIVGIDETTVRRRAQARSLAWQGA